MDHKELNKELGNIDLFLLDQILKGRFINQGKLLDAGCGEGRNLRYFLKNKYNVFGLDNHDEVLKMASLVYKRFDNLTIINKDLITYREPDAFESIICINVLHHISSIEDFRTIFQNLADSLKDEGVLFIRTLISKEKTKKDKEHLLVSAEEIKNMVSETDLSWVEPLKIESWEAYNLGMISITKK